MNIERGDDEIDLLDLLSTIWAGRYLLVALVSISFLGGFLVLKSHPSYYSIEATIDSVGKEGYHQVYPSVVRVSEYQVPKPDHERYYNKLLLQIISLNMAKSFWKDANRTEEKFNFFFRNLNLEAKNNKVPELTARKISLLHVNQEEGVDLLNNYLSYLNDQLWLSLSDELLLAYESSLSALSTRYGTSKSHELQKLNDDLLKLRESLLIAQSLKIQEIPYTSLENIQLNILDGKDYLLGTNLLNQQINILTERAKKDLSPFSNELRDLELSMEIVREDIKKLQFKKNLQMFEIVNPPQASLKPVKPNSTLILFGIVIVTALLGAIYILARHAVLIRRNSR